MFAQLVSIINVIQTKESEIMTKQTLNCKQRINTSMMALVFSSLIGCGDTLDSLVEDSELVDEISTELSTNEESTNEESTNEESTNDTVTQETITNGTGTSESTDSVLCEYFYNEYNSSDSVQMTSTADWSCDGNYRNLTANGIPDHSVGEFPNPNNPNTITEQNISESFTLSPVESTQATTLGGPRGITGIILNGVKIDAGTGGSCDNTGSDCSLGDPSGNWSIEALGQEYFDFGTDDNNAHVQPGGTYHYHGMPEGFIDLQGGNNTTMTLIGWAADGFPIYARYGFSDANDASSSLKAMTGSYQLVTTVSDSRPSASLYALGTFAQDWEYVEGSGDLDECNGRVGVTPEFPEGIYHYYATDTYPYFQRCVKGQL